MLPESELLEIHNRRDNIRKIGLKEVPKTDKQSRILHESVDETIEKVLELSDACEAKVNAKDISIAQKIRAKKPGERSVIVRFARRAGKLQLFRNKEALSIKKGYENVKKKTRIQPHRDFHS